MEVDSALDGPSVQLGFASIARYPDFKDLATKVGSGILSIQGGEPIDRYLGKLHDKGIKVHDLVAEILTNPLSQPNPLHFDLLRLFPSPQMVRLVTPNFDRHFTKAALNLFGSSESCEQYQAPALPLGGAFTGIVYLHGSVDKSSERLVLTDRDFGRAYITDGWARIFLQKLFSQYNVLFVGYSHDDTIMNYLARGLPPQTGSPQRFALTPVGNEERWTSLGITPVVYQLTEDTNKHSTLAAALDAWAIQAWQGALDQEQRIRAIVELPPPLDVEAADYIEASLQHADTTRYFTRRANTVEWLRWVEDRNLFTRLFRPGSSLTDADLELAFWFAGKFALTHIGEALSLVRRQGQQLHPALWNAIAFRVFKKEMGQRNDPEALRRWIPVLVNRWSPQSRTDLLNFLLADMKDPEDMNTAIILFEFMTRPVMQLEDVWWIEPTERERTDVTVEITTLGEEHWLNHIWSRFFSTHLGAVIDVLEPFVTSHLQLAYFMMQSQRRTADRFDHLSSMRGQIEDSSQGGPHNGVGVLIDIAYQLIKWNNSNRHDRANALITQWFSCESLVLRRLAIIGVAESSHWTPDQKLAWLLAQNLLYTYGTKHEVFEVLKSAYPGATDSSKEAILKQAEEGRTPGLSIPDDVMIYERYNLLNWLQNIAPQSALTKARFDAMQRAHPHFGRRNRPDLDVEIGSWTWTAGSGSPTTPEALLAQPPAEQIDWLIAFKPEGPFEDRSGLIESIRQAATRNYEWGIGLAREVAARSLWDSDLLPAIVQSWSSGSLSTAQWQDALQFLAANSNAFPALQRDVAMLLSEGTKVASPLIPNEVLDLAIAVSRQLWLVCSKDTGPRMPVVDKDWLATAINHPAGMLALFWLNATSKRREVGLQEESKRFFGDLLEENSFAADLVRVIFASQLTFLFGLDQDWTVTHILPLFDWSIHENRAVHAFHGFLAWGRQTEALVPHLIPLYVKAFSHIAALGDRARSRFCEYLAGLACFSSINPLTDGWLRRFVLESELRDRIAWARWIRQILRGMQDESREALWDRWIDEYWRDRLHGVPALFDAVELGEMVEWSLFLGSAFPNIVARINESPTFRLEQSFIHRELADSKLCEAFPSESAELLLVLLRNETALLYDMDRVDAVVRLITPLDALLGDLLDICNELARLGYAEAGALRQFVQGSRTP